MTDRGQLDLISLLVNLFLSPLLVHHSYTFYPFLPPPPLLSLSLVLSFFSPSALSPHSLLLFSRSPQHRSPLSLCHILLFPFSCPSFFFSLHRAPRESIILSSFLDELCHTWALLVVRVPLSFLSPSFRIFSTSFYQPLTSSSRDLPKPLWLDCHSLARSYTLCVHVCVLVSLQGWPVVQRCVCVSPHRCGSVIAS